MRKSRILILITFPPIPLLYRYQSSREVLATRENAARQLRGNGPRIKRRENMQWDLAVEEFTEAGILIPSDRIH